MKILIAYSSLSGNTEKVAMALMEEFDRYATLLPIKEVESIEEYDYIFIGYYVDRGGPPKETKDFMEQIKDKKIALFATAGVYPYSIHAFKSIVRGAEILQEKNTVLGGFVCQGALAPNLLIKYENMKEGDPKYPTPSATLRRKIGLFHPDCDDLILARKTFRDIIERDIN